MNLELADHISFIIEVLKANKGELGI